MPRFNDGIGFLRELRDSWNERWFDRACDYAVASNGAAPTEDEVNQLLALFLGGAPEQSGSPIAPAPATPAGAIASNKFLARMHGFAGFKRLAPSLAIEFPTQVSIVFGKNGSGKSSLCEALKILANADPPAKPIKNVRAQFPGSPAFCYQFRGTPAAKTWTDTAPFGSESNAVKYFDSSIAIRHVTESLQPKSVVEVAVFRLEVFDLARTFVAALQTRIQKVIADATTERRGELDALRVELNPFIDVTLPPLSTTTSEATPLAQMIRGLAPFGQSERDQIEQLRRLEGQLVAASSDEGLRGLKSQATLLGQLVQQLDNLVVQCGGADCLADLQTIERSIEEKRSASHALDQAVFANQSDPQGLHALLAAASAVRDLTNPSLDPDGCPLCRQDLGPQAAALFRAFGRHLTSRLQSEIQALERQLKHGLQKLQLVSVFQLSDFTTIRDLLPNGTLDRVSAVVAVVVGAVPKQDQAASSGSSQAFARILEISTLLGAVRGAREQLNTTIASGVAGRQQLATQLAQTRHNLQQLVAHEALDQRREQLAKFCSAVVALAPIRARLAQVDFASLMRAMTNKGKEAHKELVLSEFERRLDSEYRALCGATITDVGIKLKPSGDQQDVVVTPQVGGSQVVRVLSEGELKIYSLAVFLCEASIDPTRVLVFDDPVTSFDYNFISNFCERLRTIVRTQPNTQVIVLTHNWDFFANLQTILNRSGLGNRMTVSVLENCETVSEYKEDFAALSDLIAPFLVGPGEPSDDGKAKLAALMRRLVEVVVNRFAFNDERHQYKQKSQPVSDFPKFTKLVPLLETEAEKLRDVYANLSPTEHDDPRNFYTSRGRLQFKTWHDEILDVKVALEARRPT